MPGKALFRQLIILILIIIFSEPITCGMNSSLMMFYPYVDLYRVVSPFRKRVFNGLIYFDVSRSHFPPFMYLSSLKSIFETLVGLRQLGLPERIDYLLLTFASTNLRMRVWSTILLLTLLARVIWFTMWKREFSRELKDFRTILIYDALIVLSSVGIWKNWIRISLCWGLF